MGKKTNQPKLVDERLVKALRDPIRAHVLHVLNQRPSSPSAIAKELNEGVQRVAYHVKELEKLGAVKRIAQRNVDGASANLYETNTRQFISDDEWAQVPESRRLGITMSILAWISSDLNQAILDGTLEGRDNGHITRTPMTIDEEGWSEVSSLLKTTLEDLVTIQARATGRMAASSEEALSTKVVMMHFASLPGRKG